MEVPHGEGLTTPASIDNALTAMMADGIDGLIVGAGSMAAFNTSFADSQFASRQGDPSPLGLAR